MTKFSVKVIIEGYTVGDRMCTWRIMRNKQVMMVSKVYYRYTSCLKAAEEFALASKLQIEL